MAALEHLDVLDARDVYWAGRVTLCSRRDDLAVYDRVFAAYFGGERAGPARRPPARVTVTRRVAEPGPGGAGGRRERPVASTASRAEVLRRRDVSRLTAAERDQVNRMIALLAAGRAERPSRRLRPARRGRPDPARTVREALRRGGEITAVRRRAPGSRARRAVLIVDVSGSMAPYADALLRLAHAVVRREPRATEVFTVGTRLTRITGELRTRDPDAAMAAASAAIPDWSGGTRLGEELKEFLDAFGQRGTARGAFVVIASDGWERGDTARLSREMARLSRLAYRVIWVNPHKGHAGYEPLTAGMRAALPHVDHFVAGHSLAAYEELAEVLAGGEPPGGARGSTSRRGRSGLVG
ncbi:VWA domain-containing protein [Bailinhaonella thermotolerans]|uniref:VWA domain-containing protein n=2 Tax=Bailinhaonella thermotolerans TaxID=1070861 RepID=A0A3A4BJR7_9ACTN|nr:VWA domain-containing protein [Bailinhaonella thermotolerans]